MTISKRQQVTQFLRYVVSEYVSDGCQSTGAALTYQTLFAVVPALTVSYMVLSAFEAFTGVSRILEDFIFSYVVPENIASVQSYLRLFSDQARSLSALSFLLLGVTAFLMLFTIEKTFNEIWKVSEPRNKLQRVLMYWGLLTLGPILIVGGTVITTYLFSLPLISEVSDLPLFLQFLPWILSVLAFTLVYAAVPNAVVPFRHALLGGLLVSVSFEAAKYGFGMLMAASDFEVIYGAFAIIPVFLLWIYVTWTIILAGAEIVKALGLFSSDLDLQSQPKHVQLLGILNLFYQAYQDGRALTEKQLSYHSDVVNLRFWRENREKLINFGLLVRTEDGGLILSRSLQGLTLWQLFEGLGIALAGRQDGLLAENGTRRWRQTMDDKIVELTKVNRKILETDLDELFSVEVDDGGEAN
ncbi:MAG: YihY family inner membrane protein [Gammaproteobacteria bacterium]|jgi:membrane protein|nr:YihY family inner membrane protein [Gammaproteobacteria bacterium]MBT5202960.1 YihY family inner membrane protein [Gammaproteobacteria bacterium]MBT5600941.1 YihY family inner membrane protein [Gammaproteobacteria bacterium]MBT6245906.1 YihY family inner membrane protein [Gammaproteobacteria bacterium]